MKSYSQTDKQSPDYHNHLHNILK